MRTVAALALGTLALGLVALATVARPGTGPPPPESTVTAVAAPGVNPASTPVVSAPSTPTPEPAATAAPGATPVSTPTTAACTRTTLEAEPATTPALAADCSVLLEAKEVLAGAAALNWSAATPIARWDGVSLGGAPLRVSGLELGGRALTGAVPPALGSLAGLRTLSLSDNELNGTIPAELGTLARLARLHLDRNLLTGAIPPELGQLTELRELRVQHNRLTGAVPSVLARLAALREVGVAGNALTGCVPAAWHDVATHDLAALGLPYCSPPPVALRYDSYAATGAVTEPGSHTFLVAGEAGGDPGTVATTYEQLRTEAAAMRVHVADAAGVSHAALYDGVDAGTVVEWREAEDCWVRYRVTGSDAAGGAVREFVVTPYSYAYTGCSGAIGGGGSDGAAAAEREITWRPATLTSVDIAVPTWHGPWLLIPTSWTGPAPDPADANSFVSIASITQPAITWPPVPVPDPDPGPGWSGGLGPGRGEFEGRYAHADGGLLTVSIRQLGRWPAATHRTGAPYDEATRIDEFPLVDGNPAHVSYSRVPHGGSEARVVIYHEATGVIYNVRGGPKSRRNDPEATIELAKQFILPGNRPDCGSGVAVARPTQNPGLVADCTVLLEVGQALAGEATLNWDAARPMAEWEGVAVGGPEGGSPARVRGLELPERRLSGVVPPELGRLTGLTRLRLDDNELSGEVPAELGGLSELRVLRLGGNALAGCVPAALWSAGESDLEALGLPPCTVTLSYDAYDTTGAVTEAGSYAFFAEGEGAAITAVTTYEGLRDGTATSLLIHTSDASGTSQAAVFDGVEARDLLEWKEADDCFVRYRVTEVKVDTAGPAPRKSLGVESIAYAFTGCSGPITTSVPVSVSWGELPNLGGTSLTAPIVQGPFQLVPAGWTGATQPVGPRRPARPTIPFAEATSLAEARTLPHWREPDLPEGWTFTYAMSGDEAEAGYFEAFYDGLRLVISASSINAKYGPKEATANYDNGTQTSVRETLQIAGRPARVHYSITETQFRVTVHVWDEATGVLYMLRGSPDMATMIAFAESMFDVVGDLFPDSARSGSVPTGCAPPACAAAAADDRGAPALPARAVTLSYDTYDATGAVTEAGSYAFLTEGTDGVVAAVTTYEGLRDGTATTLLVHTSDAAGTSHADLYDDVEAGDLVEWKQGDDCFVRYAVTEVRPDPAGTGPRRSLDVEWMTYAFTGCSGAIGVGPTSASLTWGTLPDLGGKSLTAPVIHGIYQIVPAGWEGATRERESVYPPRYSEPADTEDITVARTYEFWREPTVPDDWEFAAAWRDGGDSRDGVTYGYCAEWRAGERTLPGSTRLIRPRGIVLCAHFAVSRFGQRTAGWTYQDEGTEYEAANETRVIAGRPARFLYSPPGPGFDDYFPIRIEVFDPETEVTYEVEVIDDKLVENPDAVLEMARSLFGKGRD